MKALISVSGDIKRLIVNINSFPLGRRMGGYLILLIGFALFVASSAVCLLGLWGLLESILDGSSPPYIDPEESEWDIR
jgi:hypothetical protein